MTLIRTLPDRAALVCTVRAVSRKPDIIVNLLSGNPEKLGSFFSEPVQVSDNYIYEIANYGSGVAPFYTTLGWA